MRLRRFFLSAPRRALFAVGLMLCSLAPAMTLAGTWSASTHAAKPGDRVDIELRFQGDRRVVATDAVWVLDSARLGIDAPAGTRFDDSGEGICGTNGWDRVSALYFSPDNSPLPADDRLVCVIPVQVSDTAEPGLAHIRLASSHCADAKAGEAPCEVVEGWIDIQGVTASPGPEWAVDDTLDLVIRLREGDAAQALRDVADERNDAEAAEHDLRELLDRFHLLPDSPPADLHRQQRRPPTASETAWYREHPDLASAQLHRTLVASFADNASRDKALEALRGHESVEWADVRRISVLRYPPANTRKTITTAQLSDSSIPPLAGEGAEEPASDSMRGGSGQPLVSTDHAKTTGNTVPQEHLNLLRIGQAWKIAEGWGLVGVPDTGIYREHAEFKSFSGSASTGGTFLSDGNYLPALSENVAGHGQPADNVDEFLFSYAGTAGSVPTTCDPNQDGWLHISEPYPGEGLGHGSHVAGLIAANAEDGGGVAGGCKHCGLAVIKVNSTECINGFASQRFVTDTGVTTAIASGAQAINYSGGDGNAGGGAGITIFCGSNHNDIRCTTVKAAFEDDIFVSASSGNNRSYIQAPANGVWATAIGGTQENNGQHGLWDNSPGSTNGCPFYDDGHPDNDNNECGSNFGPDEHPTAYQELMTPAVNVVSTLYPGYDWNRALNCGDLIGSDTASDGIGICTGTSMSAPQVSGIVGLIRSINPLVPVGAAKTTVPLAPAAGGIRKLLADTASRSQQ
ncbi:MAG: S8 family serine peptidase, partial [Xanthomonadales bacterium]|nr:S8 family serine peptidase [Xanthomonadales bacterium]